MSQGPLQLEGSWFNGREPDQFRWNIETRKFDSWSARLSLQPAAGAVDAGQLRRSEEPGAARAGGSGPANDGLDHLSAEAGAGHWATTLACGRNRKSGPETNTSEPGWLLESTYVIRDTHTFFARAEQVEERRAVRAKDIRCTARPSASASSRSATSTTSPGPGRSTGASAAWSGFFDAPPRLDPYYGSSPRSYMVFLQGRL